MPFYYAVRFQDWDSLDQAVPGGLKFENPYTSAYRALHQKPPSLEAALRALNQFWATVRVVLLGNPSLRYASNSASSLFRIANDILLNQGLGDG